MIQDKVGQHKCATCKASPMEKLAYDALDSYHIPYLTEYPVSRIRYVNGKTIRSSCRFDIYCSDPKFVIEMDGKQHFTEIKFLEPLAVIIERDRWKNTYCRDNKIHLLRISYKEKSEIAKWVDQFLTAIKIFIPSTFQTKDGKIYKQESVVMCSNEKLYNKQRKK